jgi:hypothetical protein
VVDHCDFGRHLAPVREFTPKKGTLLFANMRERRMERIIAEWSALVHSKAYPMPDLVGDS